MREKVTHGVQAAFGLSDGLKGSTAGTHIG